MNIIFPDDPQPPDLYQYREREHVVYTDPSGIELLAQIIAIHDAPIAPSRELPAVTSTARTNRAALCEYYAVEIEGADYLYRSDRVRVADRSTIRPVETVEVSAKDTAKLIRAALKARFPGTKFSVRSRVATYLPVIDISWTGDPDRETVRKAVEFYEGAKTDNDRDGAGDGIRRAEYKLVDGKRVHYAVYYISVYRYLNEDGIETGIQ